jgi:hypothetical protein
MAMNNSHDLSRLPRAEASILLQELVQLRGVLQMLDREAGELPQAQTDDGNNELEHVQILSGIALKTAVSALNRLDQYV